MSTELYFQVEVSSGSAPWKKRWWHFARIRLSQDYLLFALLAGVRVNELTGMDIESLPQRGLPDDVADASLEEDSLTVDDEAAGLEVPDTCSRDEAEEWVRTGVSRYLNNQYSVTHPEFHSQSWATLEELRQVLHRYEVAGGRDVDLMRSVLAMLESLHIEGYRTRAVFWFSG
jgi:hypothetical protein